ncbi:MAG: hypothetical protein FJX75_13920 [Armatimonadetes bacterium]|nr:hypothetical protein [Armatimonadota bacterium]
MTRTKRRLAAVLVIVLLGALMVAAHAAQKLVAGQLAGGGGGGAGGGMKLVGSIPASAAGASSGGGLKLTGGFIAAAQIFREGAADVTAAQTGSGMVSALAAVPTAGGAQITFTLSAPATVEVRVLNIAGRLIKTIAPGQQCGAGLTTLSWSGLSDTGLHVPAGRYLVEVRARSAKGSASRAIAAVGLAR